MNMAEAMAVTKECAKRYEVAADNLFQSTVPTDRGKRKAEEIIARVRLEEAVKREDRVADEKQRGRHVSPAGVGLDERDLAIIADRARKTSEEDPCRGPFTIMAQKLADEDVPALLSEVGLLRTAASTVLDEMLREKSMWTGAETNYPAWLERWPTLLSDALGRPADEIVQAVDEHGTRGLPGLRPRREGR